MLLIDTNVLVNAARKDADDHLRCLAWLDEVYRSRAPFGFTEMIACGFLRIISSPRIYSDPTPMDDANAAVYDITSRREFMWLNAGHDHWAIFEKLCKAANVRGKLVNDAWIAAIAIEANHELVTLDKDFARFSGLRCRFPS